MSRLEKGSSVGKKKDWKNFRWELQRTPKCALVGCCCVTRFHTFRGLKQPPFLISQFLWVRVWARRSWVLCTGSHMLQPGVRTSLSSGVLTGEESSPHPLVVSTVHFPCLCDRGFSSCRLSPRATLLSQRPSQPFTMGGFTSVVIRFFKASNGGSNPWGEPTPLYKSPLIKSGPPLWVKTCRFGTLITNPLPFTFAMFSYQKSQVSPQAGGGGERGAVSEFCLLQDVDEFS